MQWYAAENDSESLANVSRLWFTPGDPFGQQLSRSTRLINKDLNWNRYQHDPMVHQGRRLIFCWFDERVLKKMGIYVKKVAFSAGEMGKVIILYTFLLKWQWGFMPFVFPSQRMDPFGSETFPGNGIPISTNSGSRCRVLACGDMWPVPAPQGEVRRKPQRFAVTLESDMGHRLHFTQVDPGRLQRRVGISCSPLCGREPVPDFT